MDFCRVYQFRSASLSKFKDRAITESWAAVGFEFFENCFCKIAITSGSLTSRFFAFVGLPKSVKLTNLASEYVFENPLPFLRFLRSSFAERKQASVPRRQPIASKAARVSSCCYSTTAETRSGKLSFVKTVFRT